MLPKRVHTKSLTAGISSVDRGVFNLALFLVCCRAKSTGSPRLLKSRWNVAAPFTPFSRCKNTLIRQTEKIIAFPAAQSEF